MMSRTFMGAIAIALAGTAAWAEPAAVDATWGAHSEVILDLTFSPDSRQLATAADDGTLKLWDVASHKQAGSATGLLNGKNRVRFSNDGKTVYALGVSDSLVRLNAATGQALPPIALKSVPGGTASFDVSPDGKSIAVVGRGSLRILSATDGSQQQSWEVHALYGINDVAYSPDGKLVATAGTDKKALLVEPTTGNIPQTFALPLNGVAVKFSPDGKTLFAVSSDSTLKSFDVASGDSKTLIDQRVSMKSLAVTPDGKSVYIGGTGRKPWRVALPGGEVDETPVAVDSWNKAIATSPDGNWVAGGANDGSVYLFKAAR